MALRVLCVVLIAFSSQMSGRHWSFFPIVFLFPECHLLGITQYVAISFWLPLAVCVRSSLQHAFNSLILPFSLAWMTFYFLDEVIYHVFSKGKLGCVQNLETIHKPAINTLGLCVFVKRSFYEFGGNQQEAELPGHMVRVCLSLLHGIPEAQTHFASPPAINASFGAASFCQHSCQRAGYCPF